MAKKKDTVEKIVEAKEEQVREAEVVKPVEDKPAKAVSLRVDSGNDIKKVLEWDAEGIELVFDDADLLVLSEDQYRSLSHHNQKQYVLAETFAERRKKFEASGGTRGNSQITIVDPLDGRAANKLRILNQDKDGKRIVFKRPDEVSGFEELGYKRFKKDSPLAARVPGTRQDANGYMTVNRMDGQPDLYPMAVDVPVSDEIRRAPELKSRQRIARGKEDFKDYVRERSRKLSGKHRVEVVDESE